MKGRSSAVLLLANLAPLFSGLVTAPMTARALGVVDRGHVSILMVLGSVLTAAGGLGLGWAARHHLVQRPEDAGNWRALSRQASRILGSAVVIITILGATYKGVPIALTIAVASWVGVCSTSAGRAVDANVLIVTNRLLDLGVANLAMSAFALLSTSLLFFTSALSLTTSLLISSTALLVQGQLLRRGLADIGIGTGGGLARQVWTARGSWMAQCSEALIVRADTTTVAWRGSSHQLGLYSVVALLPQVLYQLTTTLTQRSYAANPTLDRNRRILVSTFLNSCVAVLVCAIAVPVAYQLVPVVFGAEFTGSRQWLWPAASFGIGVAAVTPSLLDAAGRGGAALFVVVTVWLSIGFALWVAYQSGDVDLAVVALGAFAAAIGFVYAAAVNGFSIAWFRPSMMLRILRVGQM